MNASKPAGPILAIVGGIAVAAGAFLAWATISLSGTVDVAGQQLPMPNVSQSVSGINTTDGKITIIAGILGVIGGLAAMSRSGGARKGIGVLLILMGLLAGGLGIYDITQTNNLTTSAADDIRAGVTGSLGVIPPEQQAQVDDMINQILDKLEVSTGIGLYLTTGGGLAILIGGILTMAGAGSSAGSAASGGAWAPPAGGQAPPPPPPAPDAGTTPPPATPPATPPPPPADGGSAPPA